MKQRERDNLNPTPEARFAMCHWHDRYADQRGGTMDFYLEVISKAERAYCVESVREILQAAVNHRRKPNAT